MIEMKAEEKSDSLQKPPSSGFVSLCEKFISVTELLNCTLDQVNYFVQGLQYNATDVDENLKAAAILQQNRKRLDRSPETMRKLKELEDLENK